VPAARGQISRKAHHQAASEDWGYSPCRRQPASTQTRHHSQHHSEDYCEREVDEVEWQGGRVYLHLGARRDDPPQGQPAKSLTSIGAGRRQGGHGGLLGRLHTADCDPGGDEPGGQGQDAGWLLRCRELRA
jgi:hypothetical protein